MLTCLANVLCFLLACLVTSSVCICTSVSFGQWFPIPNWWWCSLVPFSFELEVVCGLAFRDIVSGIQIDKCSADNARFEIKQIHVFENGRRCTCTISYSCIGVHTSLHGSSQLLHLQLFCFFYVNVLFCRVPALEGNYLLIHRLKLIWLQGWWEMCLQLNY